MNETIVKKLENIGYKIGSYIDAGSWGEIYDIGNSRVLKYTTDTSEANLSQKIINNIINVHSEEKILSSILVEGEMFFWLIFSNIIGMYFHKLLK